MAVKIRRTYKGAAVSALLDSSGVSSATQTAIGLSSSPSTWPTGKFFVVVAPGTAQEEKMCVTLSGATLTVVDPAVTSTAASANGRGVDNTTARTTIAAGATVYPVYTAVDADEANELTSTYSAQGHIVYQGASTFTGLAIGTAGQVLKVNSGATAPEWGQVGTAGIANDAVTADKIGAGEVGASELASSAVTEAKMAAALKKLLVPVGTISAYGGATAPTGWLLCNGDAINASYTELIALVGANTPDMRGRFPLGDDSSLTLLATGGSTTIATSNLPSHTHAIDHDHASFNTASGGTHNHTISDPGHVHAMQMDTQGYDAGSFSYGGFNAETTANTNSNTTGITVVAGEGSHTHAIDVPAFTGTSGATGGASAYWQPHVVLNFIIKHDY